MIVPLLFLEKIVTEPTLVGLAVCSCIALYRHAIPSPNSRHVYWLAPRTVRHATSCRPESTFQTRVCVWVDPWISRLLDDIYQHFEKAARQKESAASQIKLPYRPLRDVLQSTYFGYLCNEGSWSAYISVCCVLSLLCLYRTVPC